MTGIGLESSLIEVRRVRSPFPIDGVYRDEHGIPRYEALPKNLVELLHHHALATPNVEAVIEIGGARLSYQELWSRASRVAGGLREMGIGVGDRVTIRYAAGTNWALAFWGTVMCGAIAVAVNTRSSQEEIDFLISDSGARLDLVNGVPLPDGDPFVLEDVASDTVAAMFYTSGTTSRPKGVPTTHEAFLTNMENVRRCFGFPAGMGAEFRTLVSAPLFHVTACNSQFLAATYLGGTSVIVPVLDLPAIIRALAQEAITFMVTVPAVYALILRHPDFAATDVSAVRWVGYGGAPIAPSLVQSLRYGFASAVTINGYGMTETASLITVLPGDEAQAHADSVGYAVPSVDLAVFPIDDDPNVGELLVRGANVLTAYWNRPEETAEAIAHGWLRTGDVVRVDDDGRVHLIDRTKDVINRGGEKVSSIEVEAVLASAPGVADAAVIGVPDDVMGEKVGAVLVAQADTIDVEQVLKHCQEHLADFKVPQYLTAVDSPLPRNAGGKLLKNLLRDQVQWGKPLR
ncbi:MAG: putative fatty-acid-CoA ligase [Marmoricola sp.]|nr:putative fatty-acid-CoA ligase [Marmoricola sp.]